MKPLIFSVGDTEYYNLYAKALGGSAKKHGMETHIVNVGNIGRDACWERFRILPTILTRPVLMVDIDSIIRAPIEMGREDIALFLRPWRADPHMKTLLATMYITPAAMDFAKELAAGIESDRWGTDQRVAWELYEKYQTKYRIRRLTNLFLDWHWPTSALIYSPKGPRKKKQPYLKMLEEYA